MLFRSPAGCVVLPRVVLGTADLPSGTALHLSDVPFTRSFLRASTSPRLGADGLLAAPDVYNAEVSAVRAASLGARSGTTYVQVVTEGCGTGASVRRMGSPVETVLARGGRGALDAGPHVFSARAGAHLTFSWEPAADTTAAYLNVTTDPSFARIDAVNATVEAAGVYTWTRGFAGARYHVRVAADGPSGRRLSNTLVVVP